MDEDEGFDWFALIVGVGIGMALGTVVTCLVLEVW